jgi:CheY-like chemotaxis protein
MSRIAGKRVLLVEDEALIALALEDMLLLLGAEVVGPAYRLDDAVTLALTSELDAAILDVNLNEQRSYAVADELAQRGIPFIFATGYGEEGVRWGDERPTVLAKPYRQDQVEAALDRLLG